MRYYISPPPASPLARVLGSVFAILLIVGAFVFGLFVLAVAVALGVVLWAGMVIRAWWLRRQGVQTGPSSAQGESQVIDAEYRVISRRRD